MELINYTNLHATLGGSFSNGWDVMKKYFLHLLLVVIVVGLFTGGNGGVKYNLSGENFDWSMFPLIMGALVFGFLYSFLFLPLVVYGSKLIYLDAVREKELDLKRLINGFSIYLKVILANLLKFVLVFAGLLFLVIPGIVVACRLVFVPYLVMDEKLDAVQAVERSWKLTKGLGWTVFFMAITSFFIVIAGLICFIVGIFPALIWVHSSFASLYQAALNEEQNWV